MKKLVIIVPRDSSVDSYLKVAGFIYDKIVYLPQTSCYKMNISLCLQFIDFLVGKFCFKDFSVRCHHGVVTFRVRS